MNLFLNVLVLGVLCYIVISLCPGRGVVVLDMVLVYLGANIATNHHCNTMILSPYLSIGDKANIYYRYFYYIVL